MAERDEVDRRIDLLRQLVDSWNALAGDQPPPWLQVLSDHAYGLVEALEAHHG